MKKNEIRIKVDEMLESILVGKTDKSVGKAKQLHNMFSKTIFEKQQSTVTLEESLDMLRLHIKYTIFDLEATKRENKVLRNLLRERE